MPTQIREIRYRGFSTTPDDYAVPDGDLEGVSGLVPEDEALKPIQPPAAIFDLTKGKTIDHVHVTPSFRHYILRDPETGELAYTKDGGTLVPLDSVGKDITEIQSIGNTLLVLTPTGMHYFLYKDSTKGYIHLGDQIPFPKVSFALKTKEVVVEENYDRGQDREQQLASLLNRMRAKHYDKEGKFIFPFFIRYALRLYDGSTTMPSPPVLMIPTTCNRFMFSGGKIKLSLSVSDLSYALDDPEDYKRLTKWGDIVKSIDIFISSPIYTWDQEHPLTGNGLYTLGLTLRPFSISRAYSGFTPEIRSTGRFQPWIIPGEWEVNIFEPMAWHDNRWYALNNSERVDAQIRGISSFYLIMSTEINIWLMFLSHELDIRFDKEGFLENIATYETLHDDAKSHHKTVPMSAYIYNSRLNITGLSEQLLPQSDRWKLFPHTTPVESQFLYMFFVIKGDDGEDVYISAGVYSSVDVDKLLTFVYCPDHRAYKVVAYKQEVVGATWVYKKLERELTKHSLLSGAYTTGMYLAPFGGWVSSSERDLRAFESNVQATSKRTFPLPNKVYTSEVNNPFNFPTRGVNSIGTGKILGISAATKALSAGQFGQFPLYALSTDGVWALEVAKDGTYTAKQPISRDVCINPKSITQIDNAVLFTSERGIMMLSGSQCVCISDSLDPNRSPSLKGLPKSNELSREAGIPKEQTDHLPIKDFLAEAEMIYDYPRQRLYAYNPKTSYAYVYSLKSKQWSTTPTDIRKAVNSYPQTIAVTKDGKVVDYSKIDPTKGVRGLLVTRPLKLGAPDVMKTIRSVIQRGYFHKGHVRTILYGSRDLLEWHVISSSADHILRGISGTPFKYFKVALLCQLDPEEAIFGCTIEYLPKMTDRPR